MQSEKKEREKKKGGGKEKKEREKKRERKKREKKKRGLELLSYQGALEDCKYTTHLVPLFNKIKILS